MRQAAKRTRENRTITVDFRDDATYLQLLGNGKAFVEFVGAFLLSLGFQLAHKATCRGGGCLTRHSHYVRVRLGGITIWRLQCTTCHAVFTVLPHFVLRYRSMRPEVVRDALLATLGGLSLELCAVICHISPLALYRLVCTFGRQSLVAVLTRCGLPLPVYCLADEKHICCLTDKVYLPTIVCGQVLSSVSTGGCPPGAVIPGQRGAHRWLRQHDQESADALSWRPRGYLPAPRAPQAPEEIDGHHVPGAQGLALAVPHPVVSSEAAQELARVCAGATAAPLCGLRHRHCWARQWRTRATLVSGQAVP